MVHTNWILCVKDKVHGALCTYGLRFNQHALEWLELRDGKAFNTDNVFEEPGDIPVSDSAPMNISLDTSRM